MILARGALPPRLARKRVPSPKGELPDSQES